MITLTLLLLDAALIVYYFRLRTRLQAQRAEKERLQDHVAHISSAQLVPTTLYLIAAHDLIIYANQLHDGPIGLTLGIDGGDSEAADALIHDASLPRDG